MFIKKSDEYYECVNETFHLLTHLNQFTCKEILVRSIDEALEHLQLLEKYIKGDEKQ